MSNKYFSGRKGPYIYCDLCGQACYVDEVVRLKSGTGRPGLLVCPNDADGIDYGLFPRITATEKPVKWTRINHQNVTNGSEPENVETSTSIGV